MMIQILHQTLLVDHQVNTVILLMKIQKAQILLVIPQGHLDIPLPSLTLRQTVLDPLRTWPLFDDEEEDSPLSPPSQNLDIIDLTEDTDMEPTSQPETLFQPESSNFEGRRKRKANDIDTYHHNLIEFEATGKLPLKISFLFQSSPMYLQYIRYNYSFTTFENYCSSN